MSDQKKPRAFSRSRDASCACTCPASHRLDTLPDDALDEELVAFSAKLADDLADDIIHEALRLDTGNVALAASVMASVAGSVTVRIINQAAAACASRITGENDGDERFEEVRRRVVAMFARQAVKTFENLRDGAAVGIEVSIEVAGIGSHEGKPS